MNSATYRVAKASGGCCHYAEITVEANSTSDESSIQLSPDVFAWLKDDYGPDAWEWPVCDTYRVAAVAGAKYALENREATTKNNCHAVITKIHAAPADTSWDSVAFASCFALWKAIGTEGINQPYWEGRNVVFPNGT